MKKLLTILALTLSFLSFSQDLSQLSEGGFIILGQYKKATKFASETLKLDAPNSAVFAEDMIRNNVTLPKDTLYAQWDALFNFAKNFYGMKQEVAGDFTMQVLIKRAVLPGKTLKDQYRFAREFSTTVTTSQEAAQRLADEIFKNCARL